MQTMNDAAMKNETEKTQGKVPVSLTYKELSFLQRILRNRKMFLVFSYAGIGVSASLLVLYIIFLDNLNGTRFALIIMILLQARANLKLYKATTIIQKLTWQTLKSSPGN